MTDLWKEAEPINIPVSYTLTVMCDRCQKRVEGMRIGAGTAGFYETEQSSRWAKYADAGELIICDACMHSDERYQADYGFLTEEQRECWPAVPRD